MIFQRIKKILLNYKILIIPILYYVFIVYYSSGYNNFLEFIEKSNIFKIIFLNLPYVLIIISIIISVIFNNSTVFFITLITGYFYFFFMNSDILANFIIEKMHYKHFKIFNFNGYKYLFSLLLPVNFLFLTFYSETGIFNLNGLKKLLIIFAEIFFMLYALSFSKNFVAAMSDLYTNSDKFSILNIIDLGTIEFAVLELTIVGICMFFIFVFATGKHKYKFIYILSYTLMLYASFQHKYDFKVSSNILMKKDMPLIFTGCGIILVYFSIVSAYIKAYKDELTQIFGRRALNEEFHRLTGKYCICMIDIDHFKKFNDTYGHHAGDIVLYNVAQILEQNVSGKVFRFGGEEFTIIFNNGNLEKNVKEIDEIRKYISKNKINIGKTKKSKKEKKVKVNISAGVSIRNKKYNKPMEVLRNADEFLYKAKENGRNRVEYNKQL